MIVFCAMWYMILVKPNFWSVFLCFFISWGSLTNLVYVGHVKSTSIFFGCHYIEAHQINKRTQSLILDKEVDICDTVSHDSYQYPRGMAYKRLSRQWETHLLCCHTWYGYVWLSIRHQNSTYQNKISYFNIIDPFTAPCFHTSILT